MHIINLSKVETVFPFFKKRDVTLSRVLLKQQCRLSAQVEWGWEKWEKTHRQRCHFIRSTFNVPIPIISLSFGQITILTYMCDDVICVKFGHMWSNCCVFCSNFPTFFQIYERQGVSGWHTCAVPHMALACSPVCRQICPMPTVGPARHYKPSLALEPSPLHCKPGLGIASLRHCPVDASGLVVHCARWTDTCQFMWGRVGVEAAWFFYILKGFKLSLEPQVWSKDWQRRKRKTFFGMGGWYIEAVTTNQRLVSTVCEVFMVASSRIETSTLCFVYIEFSMQSGLSSPANWDFFASFLFHICPIMLADLCQSSLSDIGACSYIAFF